MWLSCRSHKELTIQAVHSSIVCKYAEIAAAVCLDQKLVTEASSLIGTI